MALSGILSVFCALGTLLGLAVFIFGMISKNGRPKRILGATLFIVSFFSLFFLLSKYGSFNFVPESSTSSPQERSSSVKTVPGLHRIYSYDRMVRSKSDPFNAEITPLMGLLELPIEVAYDSTFRVYSNKELIFERLLVRTDSLWILECGSLNPSFPFCGEYVFEENAEFMVLYEHVSSINDQDTYEVIQIFK
ncbi:MAG: hypothetical protein P8N19_09330 [Flavobacteriales bacterium]|nr:hypothetical protein [Flavobacteriales bacterium]MDG1766711.1 hypothetical protein [Flavobacteriales bacterium]